MGINTMDYVRGVEQASGIYAQALHEYSIENTKLERENEKLKRENEKMRELVIEYRRLADAIHTYWADGMNQEQFEALMKVTARVNRLSEELGIEADA